MTTPNDRPAEPRPVLPIQHTAQYMEDTYVRPSRIAGCVEVVRAVDGVVRATLKCPREDP